MLSEKVLSDLADFLPRWHGNPTWPPGVEAVCIAGGGEPLLNPAVGMFIEKCIAKGIDVGVVTNGILIDKFIEPLSKCTWVGISVDCATPATFSKLKKSKGELFEKTLDNISSLIDYAKTHDTRLAVSNPSYGVSYKYLLYNKDNIGEVYNATKLAKEIGCKHIHFRPSGNTWDKLNNHHMRFSPEDIALWDEEIKHAMELDDENFNVYGITHKFNSQFDRANYFNKCWAIFMTAVIMPPTDISADKDSFTFGLCCDRRGDSKLELAKNISNVEEILILWGREPHWKIHNEIDACNECPRCTYQPHNQIYEQVILADSMTYRFI
jgi:MoaA/NifB/PqqE/SkfB family radical SAM enzyme